MATNGKLVAYLDMSTCDEETLGDRLAPENVLAVELSRIFKNQPNHKSDTEDQKNVLRFPSQMPTLTERQQQVLMLFSQGLSYKEIAEKLQIKSHKTVANHLDGVRIKLSAKTRRECIQKASEYGLL